MTFFDPRFWLAAALAFALAFGGGYFKGDIHGKHAKQLEWDASVAAANEEARRLENARQSAAASAARAAASRESRILADAARARDAASGLRDDLDATKRWAAQSRAAADKALGVTSGLLERCEARYLGVAESASRADSYARQLMGAWPK